MFSGGFSEIICVRYIFVGVYFCMLVVVAKMAHAKKVKAIESLGEIKAPAGLQIREN